MDFQIARARDYYQRAQEGIPMLALNGRLAVQASWTLQQNLDKIEAIIQLQKRDNHEAGKLAILPRSIMTVMKGGKK